MRALDSRADCDLIATRIGAVTPADRSRWGRMSVEQMVCHLRDSYLAALGEKDLSPASGFLERTVVKWIALNLPAKWPHGVRTRPEVEQGVGGTPPVGLEQDREALLEVFKRFCIPSTRFAPTHAVFGPMSRRDWLRWGYLHADHHLRQFGR
jgi:Protein of unknown function (DUF1569)